MINDDDHLSLADVTDLHFNINNDIGSPDNPGASLLEDGSGELRREFERFERPNVKWLWVFPEHIENKLKVFDDPIIKVCQSLQGKFWKWFSLAVTGVMAIEIGIAVPFVLFFLGYDGIATELAYLALILALVSQIPKRFVWRLRPYMAGRATKVKKDMTSSFPSRAVTCATVYSFAIIWAYVYVNTIDDNDIDFEWWMPILFVGAVLLSSFARINLGVHYPSDCVGGLIQGLVICLIGTGLWRTDILGCESCHARRCYAHSPETEISLKSGVGRLNIWLAIIVVAFILGVPALSVMKPLDFWNKCDRVYGMLLPGIAFQLLMLCPHSSKRHYSLPPPPPPHWYSFILSISLVAAATGVGLKFGGKRPMLMYALLFLGMSFALFFWRLGRL